MHKAEYWHGMACAHSADQRRRWQFFNTFTIAKININHKVDTVKEAKQIARIKELVGGAGFLGC